MEAMKSDSINRLTQYCIDNLDFSKLGSLPQYQSLSACLLDCVFSLNARYESAIIPVVDRYAEKYMSGDRFSSGDTLCDLLCRIDESGGTEAFADVLNNHQKIGRRRKTEVCYEIADKLTRWLSINSFEDFRNYNKPDLLEAVLYSVKGFGDAGVNYLFMLAGDENRCKPDVHIHHCIKDATGEDVSNAECQDLFRGVTSKLKADYPELTVRKLDNLVWDKYQKSSRKR